MNLTYESLERLRPTRPVDRLSWISEACRGANVLDIGCYDETALIKRSTEHWLHGRIAQTARHVLGVDNSSKIPDGGIETGPNSRIVRGDGTRVPEAVGLNGPVDVIVAGELIEHLPSPLGFMQGIKERFSGSRLIVSTPNGATFANTLMGAFGREVQHPDHLHNFTYKTLNTLCMRAGFRSWTIRPYRFYATEMILNSRGGKRLAARAAERLIRIVEWTFPLLCFGYIVDIDV